MLSCGLQSEDPAQEIVILINNLNGIVKVLAGQSKLALQRSGYTIQVRIEDRIEGEGV